MPQNVVAEDDQRAIAGTERFRQAERCNSACLILHAIGPAA